MAVKRASAKSKSDNVFGQARKPAKMLRAGLYARVSTNDQQTLAMQNRAMREYAARRGWKIALQVREVNSGAAARREAREKVLEAARRREIDLVLVWRLDRLGRSVHRPSGDAPGTGASRSGLRISDRGAGPHYARGSSDGGAAGRIRCLRTGDPG